MLYIASALSPTPILDTRLIPSFTEPGSSSLIVAKPDCIEVWDTDKTGLVFRTELALWGNVVGIEAVYHKDTKPHILVLLAPPNAHILLLSYTSTPRPSLVVNASLPLTPPTPTLRQAEFLTSVVSQGNTAVVSLWIGVLSCIEIDVEKEKVVKQRRASEIVKVDTEDKVKKLVFRDNFNINIREHNLLHLAYLPPSPASAEPTLSFLYLSSTSQLLLQTRKLSLSAHSFVDTSRPLDVVSPTKTLTPNSETDFSALPFSCPAARRVLPIPTPGATGEKYVLVIGDEYSVLYAVTHTTQSPRISRAPSISSATSPRASNIRRSPQNEITSGTGKRRKSSMGSKGGEVERWEVKPVWRIRQGLGTVLAATVLESHPTGASVLIGDESGRLTAIGWEFNRGQFGENTTANGSVRVRKIDMGTASPPSSLSYLDNAHVFLSSPCGDSLLLSLRLPPASVPSPTSPTRTIARPIPVAKGKGRAAKTEEDGDWAVEVEDDGQGEIDVKERWMNLAPVKDLVVVEEEGGGMSHMIVSSGASNTNSLRIVRSGVGLEEIISVEGVTDVKGIWNLTSSRLLISTSSSTVILEVGSDIEIADSNEVVTAVATIAAGQLPGQDAFVQVTAKGVSLIADLQGSPVASWAVEEGNEVVAAQIQGEWVIVAQRQGKVVILNAAKSQLELAVAFAVPGEVSSISILSLSTLPSPVIAIGTWSNEILVYSLSHLLSNQTIVTTINEQYFPSSLLLKPSCTATAESSGTQLLAGLSDGSMLLYDLEQSDSGGGVIVKGRKVSSLGNRPLVITSVPNQSEGEERIIALGLSERLSVIFESKERIDFSSISSKDVTAATTISTPTTGTCLVLATLKGLVISKVNSLKKLSVQTLDLGEKSVGKMVSLDESGLLGVGATLRKVDLESGDIEQSGAFELRDSTSLKVLADLPLQAREEVTSLSEVLLLGKKYVAVGTAIFADDEEEDEYTLSGNALSAKTGRLVLVETKEGRDGDWKIGTVVSMVLGGAVYDSKAIHGFLAVAAGSKVSIHRLDNDPTSLVEISHFSSLFIAQHLYITPSTKMYKEERLVVGDGMRSVFVLDVDEANGVIHGDQRDMGTHQVLGLEGVRDGGEGVVVADGYSNVITFRLKEGIEGAASFGLHEDIARFRQGSFAPPSSAADVINPEILFATTDGRLGIVGELTPGATKTLDDLQRNMDKYYKGPGGISWKSWRRGGTELVKRETAGFVDGDFVQQFLDADLLPSSEGTKILSGTTAPERVSKVSADGTKDVADRADVVRLLEAVAGLH